MFLLGNSVWEQDAYDWLFANGVDISGFVFGGEDWYGADYFLGKKRVSVSEVMNCGKNAVVINCMDENGALGLEMGEYYYYYCGLERNEQYFMLRDYVNVPHNNLVHVLKGKMVLLVGDEMFCRMLAGYLENIEQGEIHVRYGELSDSRKMEETAVICAVYPNNISMSVGKKGKAFQDTVTGMGDARITWYFSDPSALVAVDHYRNRALQKYSLPQLKPKGILLGSFAYLSGNVFVSGIMDGHPNMIVPLEGIFTDSLWYYSILLAAEKTEDILERLASALRDEYRQSEITDCFPHWDIFKSSVEKWLLQKESFSSQELFMIFVASYTEMLTGEKITDLSSKVVYWEPHLYHRTKFCYLAKWLGSEGINGQTMILRRDNIARWGSLYNYIRKEKSALRAELETISYMCKEDWLNSSHEAILNKHWQIFTMRFEDIKLHPREELTKVCERMKIPWSDTMLHTTICGKPSVFLGSKDFTLRPVFDRREKYFSLFDQFRISVLSAPYQKKYGYPYVDCRKFSRAELWELFLKKFRFQSGRQFDASRDMVNHCLKIYAELRSQLWEARKHAVLDDIVPQFGSVEIDKPLEIAEKNAAQKKTDANTKREKLEQLASLVRQQEKLILYGTGRDCDGLLNFLSESEQNRLLYCDRKASYGAYIYRGKKVIAPSRLCGEYKEYMILITSSMYATSIQWELEDMGVAPERIICNTECLWWD